MGPILRLLPGFALLMASALTASAACGQTTSLHMAANSQHSPAANPDQLAAGARLARTFASTWNRRDGLGYGEAYWADAELVDPSGQVWNGRKAIVQTHLDLWAGPAKATHMTAHVRRVRSLSPSLFVVDIDTSATGFSPPPPGASDGVVQTRLKHVVEKRGGQWKILTSQNTFVSRH
jgi:uncharacterized protein (TIGR02246 family)